MGGAEHYRDDEVTLGKEPSETEEQLGFSHRNTSEDNRWERDHQRKERTTRQNKDEKGKCLSL